MLSLHVFCRALRSKVIACQVAAAAVPELTRLHFYSFSHKISTSCSTNACMNAKGENQARNKKSDHQKSVFSAGSFKERGEGLKNKIPLLRGKKSSCLSLPTEPLGSDGWTSVKEQSNYRARFEECVMNDMIAANTDFKIAKSFLSFLAQKNGDICYPVLLKYLVLCVNQNQLEEVCDLYDIIKLKFQAMLPFGAGSLFIRGFTKTHLWREAISVLEAIKKEETASARNFGECIKAAIEHHDAALAWTLYDEVIQKHLLVPEDVIQSLFDASEGLQDDGYRKKLLDVLRYFRENQLYPKEALMKSVKSWFESIPNESWKGTLTEINNCGHCRACNQQIESIQLTPDEYDVLKKEVISSIIKGEDIFCKTTPKELSQFLMFVDSQPPYDFVVDGLNVAHHNYKMLSKTLLDVVSHLAVRKRVLVLGRKHMLVPSKMWNKQHIQQLQRISDCFFIENESLDDPFLLYASLNSGSHCCFLTKDLLRDHKACLPDPETRQLFFKWQRGHQLALSSSTPGRITLQPVLSYDSIIQWTDTSYHIPYDKTDVVRASYEVPRTWLCLKKSQ